ncbi:transposase [Ktedonobacter sp. SOSP1-85]|uniref:transposase n=1 Tax=Ktedonobacter sp. SOSP1-85 TaxID=2778367 RepID=UPI001914FAFC
MDDETNNHAKFLILSHMIVVCKYRKKLLLPYGEEVKNLFESIAARSSVSFERMNVDEDHIHCLKRSEPKLSLLVIVCW